MSKRAFGDLECSIINVVRSLKKVTVKQVQEALGNEDKYTTIMTVMSRLVDKKILGRERNGSRYVYWFLEEQNNPQSILQRIRSRLFGVKTSDVVSYLISSADDLSTEDIEQVERLIAKAKQKNKQENRNE